MMGRYTRTVQVDAFRASDPRMPAEFRQAICRCTVSAAVAGPEHVHTAHGPRGILPGHWLVRGPWDDFYPWAPDLFAAHHTAHQ